MDSLIDLSRLNKLKGLAEKKKPGAKQVAEEDKRLSEAKKKAMTEADIMNRINAFQQGFESEEESEDDEEDGEDGDRNLSLDLSSVRREQQEQRGTDMYPSSQAKIDPAALAASLLSGNGDEEEESAPPPIPIRSVGEVRSQYRERLKVSEAQTKARHARHVAAKAVVDSSMAEEKKRKKKKKGTKMKAEAKSSLDYLEEDDGALPPDPTDPSDILLLSDLRYTEFSSNYIMRGDLMKQCGDVLQSGRSLVLRTHPGEDALDAKMMLRTIATELAMYHASEFIIPDIAYDSTSGTTEMRLEPKE